MDGSAIECYFVVMIQKYLDEVVVVGSMETQKKVNVTGAVSMVGSDVIESALLPT